MGLYSDWKQPQLQAEASKRTLSAAGTNAEIIARLEQDDLERANASDDLLNDLEPAAPVVPPQVAPVAEPQLTIQPAAPGQPAGPQPPIQMYYLPAPTPEPVAPPVAKTHEVTYPCHNELSTGMHEENRLRAYHDTIAAGLSPRGGLGGVSRTGFRQVDGARHAVYEVLLQRPPK